MFEHQQMGGFGDIVTGDESWLLQQYNHHQTWCLSADRVPTRVMRTKAAPKNMLKVFLGIHGAIFIDWLPPGESSKADTFVTKCSNRFPRSCTTAAVQVP
jgi:hypothetical protein